MSHLLYVSDRVCLLGCVPISLHVVPGRRPASEQEEYYQHLITAAARLVTEYTVQLG